MSTDRATYSWRGMGGSRRCPNFAPTRLAEAQIERQRKRVPQRRTHLPTLCRRASSTDRRDQSARPESARRKTARNATRPRGRWSRAHESRPDNHPAKRKQATPTRRIRQPRGTRGQRSASSSLYHRYLLRPTESRRRRDAGGLIEKVSDGLFEGEEPVLHLMGWVGRSLGRGPFVDRGRGQSTHGRTSASGPAPLQLVLLGVFERQIRAGYQVLHRSGYTHLRRRRRPNPMRAPIVVREPADLNIR